MQETWVRSLGWEDPLEKGKATHSSILGLENPHGQRSLAGYGPWDRKESDKTEWQHSKVQCTRELPQDYHLAFQQKLCRSKDRNARCKLNKGSSDQYDGVKGHKAHLLLHNMSKTHPHVEQFSLKLNWKLAKVLLFNQDCKKDAQIIK